MAASRRRKSPAKVLDDQKAREAGAAKAQANGALTINPEQAKLKSVLAQIEAILESTGTTIQTQHREPQSAPMPDGGLMIQCQPPSWGLRLAIPGPR